MSYAQLSPSLTFEEREQLRAEARALRDHEAKLRRLADQSQKKARRKLRLQRRAFKRRAGV